MKQFSQSDDDIPTAPWSPRILHRAPQLAHSPSVELAVPVFKYTSDLRTIWLMLPGSQEVPDIPGMHGSVTSPGISFPSVKPVIPSRDLVF